MKVENLKKGIYDAQVSEVLTKEGMAEIHTSFWNRLKFLLTGYLEFKESIIFVVKGTIEKK
jgi:hypothetical protein